MEESFRVRVDKAFGSLASASASASASSSSSSSLSLSSLWCLTDDEIQRNEWNRDKEVSEPEKTPRPGPFRSNSFLDGLRKEKKSADFRVQLEKDLDELDVDGDDGQEEEEERRWGASSSRSQKPDDCKEEEWEIKSSIGLDCTLDFEEEEDEYDKVAVGKEKSSNRDRLYMKDVNDYKTEADDWNELPATFKDLARDPRANHIAAKLRLKEDDEAAKKMDSLCVSEDNHSHSLSENKDAVQVSGEEAPLGSSEDGSLRSILKRKDNQVDSKLPKRVRFSSECGDDCNEEVDRGNKDSLMEMESALDGGGHVPPDYPSGSPDYTRNPSKYTCYTLDSGEMDEESNRQAHMDFLNVLKSRKKGADPLQEDASVELPKSVAFVPKRKPSDAQVVENELGLMQSQNSRSKVSEGKRGVVAIDSRDNETCPMEEDESETYTVNVMKRGVQRSGRQYRTKVKEDPDE